MDLLKPIMYLFIAFSLNAMLFLLRRRLLWDWPMIGILIVLTGCAAFSITLGDAGIYLALVTLAVGFVIAEASGRLSKRTTWARIQGNYRQAYRYSLFCFLLQPTAYNRVLMQMMKLVCEVRDRGMSYDAAQEKLQVLQKTVERVHNISLHICLWETLYAFAAVQQDWPKLARNYTPELHPIYSHPPSGAGYYMVQALSEESRYTEAATILRAMQRYAQNSKMLPEESEVFHNKARLLWLAHLGYHEALQRLLHKDSALYLLFSRAEREALLHKAHTTDTSIVLRRLQQSQTQAALEQEQFQAAMESLKSLEEGSVAEEAEEQTPEPTTDAEDSDKPSVESEDSDESLLEPPVTAEEIPALAQQVMEALQGETYLSHDFVLWGTATRATVLMLLINVVIYVAMSLPDSYQSFSQVLGSLAWKNIDPVHLLRYGGCHPGIFQIGESWRLFSGNFLHAGIIHIALNSYFLLFFGPLVERFIGPWRFINVYLLAGLAGFLAALWTGTDRVLVGASASIFGVFGATMMALYWMRHQLPKSWYRRKMVICVVLFILNTYIGLAIKAVSFSAHMGGFVVGALVTLGLLWWHPRASLLVRRFGIATTLLLWLPLAIWTSERVWHTSQLSLTARLERLLPLGAQSIPMLLTFRESSRSNKQVVEKIISQMGETARQELFRLLQQGDNIIQSMAAEVLGQAFWSPKDVVPGLYARLQKAPTDLQIHILFALHWHNFQALTPEQIRQTVKYMVKHTHSRRSWVRKNALRLLFHLGPWAKAAAPVLVQALRQHPDPQVQKVIGAALFKMGPEALKHWKNNARP